jgi:hypothetical protein
MHEYYVDVLMRCMNEYLHTQVSLDMSSALSDPAPTSAPSKNSRSGISWMGMKLSPGGSVYLVSKFFFLLVLFFSPISIPLAQFFLSGDSFYSTFFWAHP